MKMEGETLIPAPRALVFEALNDETLLIACIPGCEALERISDTELAASMSAKVGPVKANFKGEVRLENVNPPFGYTLIGQGKGAAGFAKGRADVVLHEDGSGGTRLSWSVEASIGGKLAQIGSRLIDQTARKYADDFFARFNALVAERAEGATTDGEAAESIPEATGDAASVPSAGIEPVSAEPRPGLPPLVWAGALIAALALLLWYFAGR